MVEALGECEPLDLDDVCLESKALTVLCVPSLLDSVKADRLLWSRLWDVLEALGEREALDLDEFENNYFTEMCSGSEEGSYLRLIDFGHASGTCSRRL